MSKTPRFVPTSTHWGNYLVESAGKNITSVIPVEQDECPSPMGPSLMNALDENCRIPQPMIRKSYLEKRENSDRSKRGGEPFVAVDWETALDIAADALQRVKSEYGNEAIYAGDYGWGSAGRFHHALSQLHRFMRMFGGYTDGVDSYSLGAGNVIARRVLGVEGYPLSLQAQPWKLVAEHAELVVLFGGASAKNADTSPGGLAAHTSFSDMQAAKDAGVNFVNISPVQDDVADTVGAEWLAAIPNTDTAIMLALAHTLVVENLHDQAFLDTYCVGFEQFLPYLMGETDGQPKNADWAESICGVPADTIRDLARRMANSRTMISVSWSIQRADKGEQPWWAGIVLAAMLGQIGLPGRGITLGYNCTHDLGTAWALPFTWAALPQGENNVNTFIPFARLADMLLNPGKAFDYDGGRYQYPDIQLIYWAGGNPFHHHQDINRLLEAWRKPDTIIINEHFWNASARHADIVFPASTMLERNDLGCNSATNFLIPMRQAVEPYRQSRSDYQIFSGLSERLGFADDFTENRDEEQWLQHLYAMSKDNAAAFGYQLPSFDKFWDGGQIELHTDQQLPDDVFLPGGTLQLFRKNPEENLLATPSGKIEIFSADIDSFHYEDCLGHPAWLEPEEWLGSPKAKQYPLHLISPNPGKRLHSQFDHGKVSVDSKIRQREPIRLSPEDAERRGIKDGDLVKVFNDRGACLAGAVISNTLRPGVVQLHTGAWYDPEQPGEIGSLDLHGNPNMLTLDKGSSSLSQGCSANTTLVDIELYEGPERPITVFSQPAIDNELAT